MEKLATDVTTVLLNIHTLWREKLAGKHEFG